MQRLKLRGRIIEKYGTLGNFCQKTGVTPQTVTNVLSGKTHPQPLAIIGWCHVLDIPDNEVHLFFTDEVLKVEPMEAR